MTFNYTYPTDTLSAIYFQTGRHIQASDPFMADPMLYNEKSKEIFDKLEGTRLGQTIQLNSPHYFQSQSINSFLDVDLNTLAPQALLNITFPVTLGELRLGSEITLSNNERSWQYQERPDFLTAEFKNLNDGLVSSFAAQKFNYSVNVYRNSCQIYKAIIDYNNLVAIPYLKNQTNLTAIDPSLAADVFNVMRLEEKIENITRVIGKPLEMFRGKMGRINIISRIRWKQLSSNLASQFVQPLTLDTYEDSKDVLVETPNEVYALADYAVMSNSFAVNNPNWALPSVNNDGTQGPNNAGITGFNLIASDFCVSTDKPNTAGPLVYQYPLGTYVFRIRMADDGSGTFAAAVAAGYRPVLAFGDTFYFKESSANTSLAKLNDGTIKYIRPNTGQTSINDENWSYTAPYDGAPGTTFSFTLGKPKNYNENDPSTWFYQGNNSNPARPNDIWFCNLGIGPDNFGSPLPIVGQVRPYLSNSDTGEAVLAKDPNINMTVALSQRDIDLNAGTQFGLQNYAFGFLEIYFLNKAKLIPLCGPREHVLTFKTQDHYEFSFPPKMVQPYANINFNAEIDDTFMRFIKYTGNPDVVKSVPINMGYQVSYIGRATQRITCVSALTTAFDNYQLNLGAIAIYSPSNSSITF